MLEQKIKIKYLLDILKLCKSDRRKWHLNCLKKMWPQQNQSLPKNDCNRQHKS